jgi:ferredoxin
MTTDLYDACLKCSICELHCPVFRVVPEFPGPKNGGPGLERLRAAGRPVDESGLEHCLGCRTCEVVCPSGLKPATLIHRPKIEKVRFEDMDIIRVERGSAISIHNGDDSTVEDVVFDNIRVEDARHKLIDFAVVFAQYGKDRIQSQDERMRRMDMGGAWDGVLHYTHEEKAERAKFRGHVRNVRVSNLSIVDGAMPFSVIAGFDAQHAIENVVIQNMKFFGKPVRNAADAKLSVNDAPGLTIR